MRSALATLARSGVLLEEVLKNAWLHRSRFVLSSLGIVVAVSMVLGMRTLIHGLETFVDEQFESFGTRKVYVARVPWGGDLPLERYLERPKIGPEVAAAVAADPWVETAVPFSRAEARVEYGSAALERVEVVGAAPGYLEMEGYELARGRSLLARDGDLVHRVAVVGAEVERKLQEAGSPGSLAAGGAVFHVVGTLKPRGSLLGDSLDDGIYIPLETFDTVFGSNHGLEVAAVVSPRADMEEALAELSARVRRARRLSAGTADDFALNTSARLFAEYRRVARAVSWVVYGVGLLILLVSGMGISNVMLATVRERSYEIGVKKSVGATAPDIFFETLSEVLLMCLGSGAAGILLGGAFCLFLRLVSPVAASLTAADLTLSLVFPALTAVIFGSVPASLATRVAPVRLLGA
ncbi:MAG TPA: ABC transporter permease [Thermoanaerobaculia bacterium]|nr:ABC transporter permease [Thermoanaerobaculia bacterium]